jgi:hypothetical protein
MGRWIAEEEAALAELKVKLKKELASAPQFPGNTNPNYNSNLNPIFINIEL